jgi:hypothetical protein
MTLKLVQDKPFSRMGKPQNIHIVGACVLDKIVEIIETIIYSRRQIRIWITEYTLHCIIVINGVKGYGGVQIALYDEQANVNFKGQDQEYSTSDPDFVEKLLGIVREWVYGIPS